MATEFGGMTLAEILDATKTRDGFDRFIATLPDNVHYGSGSAAPKEWNNSIMETLPCYSIPEYTTQVIFQLGRKLKSLIESKVTDDKLSYLILALAGNLFHLKKGNLERALIKYLPNGENITNKFGLNLPIVLYKPGKSVNPNGSGGPYQQAVRIDNTETETLHGSEPLVKYFCFVAAYLLRFLVKGMENVNTSWNNMNNRFYRYYGNLEPELIGMPSLDWLNELKMNFGYDRKVQNTWIKIVTNVEDDANVNKQILGLIRFVVVTPLSFSRMRVYKIFHQVLAATKHDPGWLLTEMLTPQNREALLCIESILKIFESTTQHSKPKAFKYARIIGSEYFQPIQTKQCPQLVYLMLSIVGNYEGFGGSTSDP